MPGEKSYRVEVDGQLIGTRKSRRTYTHAVVIGGIPTTEYTARWTGSKRVVGGRVVQAYSGSPALAEKAVRALMRYNSTYYGFHWTDLTVSIVPVTVTDQGRCV